MSDDIQVLKDDEKEKIATAAEDVQAAETPTQPQRAKKDSGWIVGLVLIAIGAIFLLSNFTNLQFNNWWALFILIPAVASLGNTVNDYRQNGRITSSGRGSLIGGLVLLLIAAIFLFNLDWGKIWPVFLIIGGVGALLSAWFRD